MSVNFGLRVKTMRCKIMFLFQLADWWLTAAYLAYRLPVVVHSNPALVFPRQHFQTDEEYLKYAADLTFAALNYKSDIDK
jgi:hypothetical protein